MLTEFYEKIKNITFHESLCFFENSVKIDDVLLDLKILHTDSFEFLTNSVFNFYLRYKYATKFLSFSNLSNLEFKEKKRIDKSLVQDICDNGSLKSMLKKYKDKHSS